MVDNDASQDNDNVRKITAAAAAALLRGTHESSPVAKIFDIYSVHKVQGEFCGNCFDLQTEVSD